MKPRLFIVASILLASPALARADSAYAEPNDPGKITNIGKGVWELDLGALGVLSNNSDASNSVTQLSSDISAQLHYFLKDNFSVGVEALFDYDSVGGGNNSLLYGGTVDATVHLRLGLGAFFRPSIAVGALFGERNIAMGTGGDIEQASEVGFTTRLALPIAYFVNRRFVLQAGPQVNFSFGSYTPTGGDAVSFTRVAGGFAIGLGYVF